VEEVTPIWAYIGGYSDAKEKITKTNYKYYEITATQVYLDSKYLDQYCVIVDRIITSFRKVIEKYVELYESFKSPQGDIVLRIDLKNVNLFLMLYYFLYYFSA
jgi:hypothetical protein